MAAKSFVPASWFQTDVYLKKNILSTQYALEYCKKYDAKLIFASTVLYGGNYKSPLKEDLNPIPKNPYHLSKFFCEKLCEFYNYTYNINIIILRIFNTYGLFQSNKFVVTELIEKLSKKEIYLKNKKARRDFIYIEDVISAFIKAIKKKANFLVLNIGSGKSISIEELAKDILEVFNKKVPIKGSRLFRKNDYKDVFASIKKAKKELNWSPKYSLIKGLSDLKKKIGINEK